jgi:hypothetical protein
MGLAEAPKGFGSHEFTPFAMRCLVGKFRLGFGQDLHGQEISSPNQNTSPIVSMGYRQEDSGLILSWTAVARNHYLSELTI